MSSASRVRSLVPVEQMLAHMVGRLLHEEPHPVDVCPSPRAWPSSWTAIPWMS